jgi:signal transduction histidine kinase
MKTRNGRIQQPGPTPNNTLQSLTERYRSALQDYLAGAGEAALEHAYEVGRKAIAEGLGTLEMMTIHKEALGRMWGGASRSVGVEQVVKAEEFFAESLSPFEMTYRAFREANTKLRLLSEHLRSVREEERTRIARDIHDELGQALTCLKMDVSWLSNRLSVDRSPQDSKAADPSPSQRHGGAEPDRKGPLLKKTQKMLKLIGETIRTVRRISADLRPAVLDDLGLAAAIEWQSQDFQTRTGIKCRLTLPSQNILLDQGRSTAIFRIFQETLTNVARHSNATLVMIALKRKANSLILEVKDNGHGIAESKIADVKSLGLLGMRERAAFWGGEVVIRGIRGKGTTVTVRIPIQKAAGDGARLVRSN